MKKLALILVLFFLFLQITIAQEGWIWQHPLPQGNNLNSVCILNANTLIAAGGK